MSASFTATFHCDHCGGPNHYNGRGEMTDSGISIGAMECNELFFIECLEDEGWLVDGTKAYCDGCRSLIERRIQKEMAEDAAYDMAAGQ